MDLVLVRLEGNDLFWGGVLLGLTLSHCQGERGKKIQNKADDTLKRGRKLISITGRMRNTAELEAEVTEEADKHVCANCGIAGLDNEECTECHSLRLRYCGVKCREEHREQHEEECKIIRAAELHDKNLFRQPESSHHGECPICFLPMPLDARKSIVWSCCSKIICHGCDYANDRGHGRTLCPFCREPVANDEEDERRMVKRIKANDPAALSHLGGECFAEGDYEGALEYLTKAAELGDLMAHYELGDMYEEGHGVEEDMEKAVYHYEKAAIGGHPYARHNLAAIEEENGNIESTVKHLIIAANLGYERSMQALWTHYSRGNITKEDLEATLRTHQAAIDAMKSSQGMRQKQTLPPMSNPGLKKEDLVL